MTPVGVHVIVPVQDLLTTRDMQQVIENAIEKTGDYAARLFGQTTTTWKKRPEFKRERVRWVSSRAYEGGRVYTDDEIYGYVDAGTKPHVIRAKRRKTLRFQTGHVAKTKPRMLTSYAGKRFGPWVGPVEVHHPGTEPREFAKEIAERCGPIFERRMDEEWEKAAAASRRIGSKRVR